MWLYDETRSLQARLDELAESFTRPDLTLRDYSEYLVRAHGFEAPLEAALAYTTGLTAVCRLRPRSGHIVHDLLTLGVRPQQLSQLPQSAIAPFANVATAMGWLYLQERSRLKHPVLCGRVRNRLPEAKNATDYFCNDELAVGEHWDEFATALEGFARTPVAQESVRDGARAAFECAIDWHTPDELRAAR